MTKPDMKQVRVLDLECRFTSAETGVVEGIASRFGEEDSYGDVIERGAFSASLQQHRERGTFPAMLWLHREPAGVWEVIEERAEGLYVKGRFALSTNTGREAHEHAKAGTTTGLSIGFHYDEVEIAADGTWRVKSVILHEISLTPTPAAPRARITQVRQIGGDPVPEPIVDNPAPTPDVTALEARMAEMQTRMDELEVRAQRVPAAPRNENEAEQRDIEILVREMRGETRAAGSDNGPDGGWLVLPSIDTRIRTLLADASPMRRLAEVVTVDTDKYTRFYSLGKRGAQRVSQRDDRPQDTARPELIAHTYGVGEYYAAPVATRHLLDDSPADIAAWLLNNASHDFAISEGEDFLSYTGVDDFARGLLDYGTTNEKDFVRAWGKHQYIPAGHASAPTDANLVTACINIVAALRTPYKVNAKWLMNSTTATRLQGIVDENGRRLWAPTGNLIEGIYHPLLGHAVEIDENMPSISEGAGAHPIAFGDFAQGYVVVDRHGVRVERDAVTQKGRIVFDTYKRVGGGAGDFNAIKFIKIAAT